MQKRSLPAPMRMWALVFVLFNCSVMLSALSPALPVGATAPSQMPPTTLYLPLVVKPGSVAVGVFRPDIHGFSFENYDGKAGYINMTSAEILRMFGDKVCASTAAGGVCGLTPAAEKWMNEQNESMNSGHCEGFAVLSQLFFSQPQQFNPQNFGAPTTAELQIQGNEKLQREIAYWFATQSTRPAQDAVFKGTPNEIVDVLRSSSQAGKVAEYAVGFYKRDRSGGHAVSPIAVEDRGNGIAAILIYDNNYPKLIREIIVDTNANTWRYTGSTNPAEPTDEYEGDAGTRTLELAPIPQRIPQQICTFCENAGGSETAQQEPRYNEIWLDGDADLLITEDQGGRSIGFRNGQQVNEIPGADMRSTKYLVPVWNNPEEPTYFVPTSVDFKISIDGSLLTTPSVSAVTMIGPGYVLEVNDIILEAGQVDELDVSANGTLLSYRTETGETPDILLGFETPGADYTLVVKGFAMAAGDAVNLGLEEAGGRVRIGTATAQGVAFDLLLERTDNGGTQVFGTSDDLSISPADVLYVEYAAWQGNGQPLAVEIDRGGDGTIDETVELVDATDLFEE